MSDQVEGFRICRACKCGDDLLANGHVVIPPFGLEQDLVLVGDAAVPEADQHNFPLKVSGSGDDLSPDHDSAFKFKADAFALIDIVGPEVPWSHIFDGKVYSLEFTHGRSKTFGMRFRAVTHQFFFPR